MVYKESIEPKYISNFFAKCKEHGLKLTPQRIAIYKEIAKSKDHPTADLIYHKIKKYHPYISFDTVNRTLLTFADIGLIEIVEGSGDGRRFDSNIDYHHHFRCKSCGAIIDFFSSKYESLEVPEAIKEKFKVDKVRVVIEGICDICLQNDKSY